MQTARIAFLSISPLNCLGFRIRLNLTMANKNRPEGGINQGLTAQSPGKSPGMRSLIVRREARMHPPPSPDSEKGPLWQEAPVSQSPSSPSNNENAGSVADLQVRKLVRRFLLGYDTARTIATLVYGVAR